MPQEIHVVGLTPGSSALVRRAVAVLNRVQQSFSYLPSDAHLAEEHAPAECIPEVLAKHLPERVFETGRLVIGVVDRRLEYNWFSRRTDDGRAMFISTKGWDLLTPLPVLSYVVFQIAASTVRAIAGHPPFHDDPIGCMQDLCSHKPDFNIKLRTGDVCHPCSGLLRQHLSDEEYSSLLAMLDEARRVALARVVDASKADVRSLLQTVDTEFPFPIAYTARSMQTEPSYSRKLYQLFELAEGSLKYASVVFLAAGAKVGSLEKLQRASMGTWQDTCFKLADSAPVDGFFAEVLSEMSGKRSVPAKTASNQLCEIRNRIAHGTTPSEQRARELIDEAYPRLQTLLTWLAPLSRYTLLRPEGLGTRRDGSSTFSAKLLMGSHPTFRTREISTRASFDTDCLLFDPAADRFLSLFPWLLVAHCKSCGHESVMMYDGLEPKSVKYREPGREHTHEHAELHADVARRLG